MALNRLALPAALVACGIVVATASAAPTGSAAASEAPAASSVTPPVNPAVTPPIESPVASPVVPTDATRAATSSTAPASPRSRPYEGAIGLNLSYGPEIPGGRTMGVGTRPALYLRYGRFTASTGAGFITRTRDDVVRGFGLDVVDDDRFSVSFSLRMDSGRREASSDRLTGLGDVPRTVRLRLGSRWRLDHGWQVGASWTVDAFGRGGGNIGELRVSNEYPLGEITRLLSNVSVTIGGPRYMQTYFGITEEQSVNSGYPVYDAGSGLTNVSVGVALRTQLARRWSVQVGVGASRLLGDAARSPIVERPFGWGLNAGVAWHF